MDSTTKAISDFVADLNFEDLSPACTEAAKTRLLDTLVCAWGGADAVPVAIARRALLDESSRGGATLIGGGMASAETAAFLNSLMSRYLDFNDWAYPSGHPSDMVLPLLAVAEEAEADGKSYLVALVAAYQVYLGISRGANLAKHGWDVGIALAAGTAAGCAKLHGLGPEGIANAVGIAVACGPSLSVRVTGERASMWKNGSGPHSCKTGVFAGQLAALGMTGPESSFEGRNGVFQRICEPFDIGPLLDIDQTSCVEESVLKLFPSEIHAQAPIAAALQLRDKLGKQVQDIRTINIRSYARMIVTVGSPERWNPQTREAADHSCPYMVSAALLDGALSSDSFSEASLGRQDIRDLMAKITIKIDEDLNSQYPTKLMSEFDVTLADGSVVTHRIDYPLGHPKNPASPAQMEEKFSALVRDRLSPEQRESLRRNVQHVEELVCVTSLLAP